MLRIFSVMHCTGTFLFYGCALCNTPPRDSMQTNEPAREAPTAVRRQVRTVETLLGQGRAEEDQASLDEGLFLKQALQGYAHCMATSDRYARRPPRINTKPPPGIHYHGTSPDRWRVGIVFGLTHRTIFNYERHKCPVVGLPDPPPPPDCPSSHHTCNRDASQAMFQKPFSPVFSGSPVFKDPCFHSPWFVSG